MNDYTQGIKIPVLEWDQKSALKVSPFKVNFVSEYFLLDLLYARLVEHNTDGIPTPGLATKIQWDETSVYFHFETEHSKTNLGRPIDAQMVKEFLLFHLNSSGSRHGRISDFFCLDPKSKDTCSGIEVIDKVLKLTPQSPSQIFQLLVLLESVDFGIGPVSNFNSDMSVKSHGETTGLYSLEKDDPKGEHRLRINKHHYRYRDSLPQVIDFVAVGWADLAEKIEEHQFPYVISNNTFFLRKDEIDRLSPKYNLRKSSVPFGRFLTFHANFIKKSNPLDRWRIAQAIESIGPFNREDYEERLTQIFPLDGRFSLKQDQDIAEVRNKALATPSKIHNFRLQMGKRWLHGKTEFTAHDINIKLLPVDFTSPGNPAEADGAIMTVDVVSHNLYSLASFLLAVVPNLLPDPSKKDALLRQIAQSPREQQLRVITELQLNAMTEGLLIPLVYVQTPTLTRKPLKVINTGPLQEIPYFWNITW